MALSQLISLPNALSLLFFLTIGKGAFQRESCCASALINEAIKAKLISALRYKGEEFKDVLKMGRTQLLDAVPMTAGQGFNAYANNLEEEILNLERNIKLLHEINMGGTAIGTGLNAVPGFAKLCAANLSKLTGEPFVSAIDLVEATPDTVNKIVNDLVDEEIDEVTTETLKTPKIIFTPKRAMRDAAKSVELRIMKKKRKVSKRDKGEEGL